MAIFADASAIVSIIGEEADADILTARLASDEDSLCSAIAAWEATLAVARHAKIEPVLAGERVRSFLDSIGCRIVPVGAMEFGLAVDAFARFGKGVAPAGLNMGDCFAYACAKANNARLLYKGDDFAQTDLAWRDDA